MTMFDNRGPLCTCGHGNGDHWEPTGADIADGHPNWHCCVHDCGCKDFNLACTCGSDYRETHRGHTMDCQLMKAWSS